MNKPYFRPIFLLITALFWLTITTIDIQAQPNHTAANDIQTALTLAQQNDTYTFTTDLRQTERPAPRLENIGRHDQTTRLLIDGQIDRLQETTWLTLVKKDNGSPAPTYLKIVNGTAYQQQQDGSWEPLREGADLFASNGNGNPLTYLGGATNIAYASATSSLYPTDLLPPNYDSITRITFDLDGQAFAKLVEEQTIAQLKAQNKWHKNLNLNIQDAYARMSGQGEIWLSADGHLHRQILHLTTPLDDGGQVTSHITTDFSGWAPPTTHKNFPLITITPSQFQNFSYTLLIFLATLLFTLALILHSYSPRLYTGVVAVMICSFLLTPLLQSLDAVRISQLFAPQTAEAAADPLAHINTDSYIAKKPDHHPQQNPLNNNVPLFPIEATTATATPLTYTSGTDTDGDGLNDDIEIYKLGTNPSVVDSDGDSISDLVEVQGFDVNGVTWYLNPLSIDTNGDSLPDNIECVERENVDRDGNLLATIPTPCGDLDGDGIPDVFDYDNDGDQVPDKIDLSPSYIGPATTQAQNQFQYHLTGYNINNPLKVSIEIRPQNENHLYLSGNVYDWPTNDTEGQITRVFNDTLFDHGINTDAAKNGDIMVSPELEIRIPWDPTNPTRGLPISATIPIDASTPLNSFVDQAYLDEYQINLRQDPDGTVYIKGVLQAVEDYGERIVAWHSEIPYILPTANWGADHEVRLVWTVSGLVDNCQTATKPANIPTATWCDPQTNPQNWTTNLQILHRYYDDFYVTGFAVEEDFGMNVAIIAEDDSLTTPYEDGIWHLSAELEKTYLAPETVAGNRFDIATIVNRFQDGSPATPTERWGLPADIFNIASFTYTDTVRGVNAIVETETGNHLRNTYPSAAPTDHTTLLFLQENSNRQTLLATGSTSTNYTTTNNRLTVDLTAIEPQTIASLYWRPFEYVNSNWQPYDAIDPYVTALITDVNPLLSNTNLDSAIGAGITDYTATREATRYLLKTYYILNYTGNNKLVELDNTPIYTTTLNDANHQLNGNDPLLKTVSAMMSDYFSLLQTQTIYNIDGQVVSLTGYAPPADKVEFAQQMGELALNRNQNEPISWRARNGAANGAAAGIVFLWATAMDYYKYTHSAVGFNIQTARLGLMVVGAGFLLLGMVYGAQGNKDVGRAMMITSSAIAVVATVAEAAQLATQVKHYYAAKQFIDIATVLDDATMASQTTRVALHTVKSIERTAKFAALIGFAIDILIEVAVFVYIVAYYKLDPSSVGYNLAAARMTGGIIVATITFALTLALIAAVGAVIAALVFVALAIFEAVFALACHVDSRSPNDFFCKGISGSFVEFLANELYKYHIPLNLNRSDRLGLTIQQTELMTPSLGYIPGNQLTITLGINHKQFPTAPPWKYRVNDTGTTEYHHSVPSAVLNKGAYQYFVQKTSTPPANNLTLGSQTWTYQADGSTYYLQRDFTASGLIDLPTSAGLNQPTNFYLIENGHLPLLSCWTILAFYQCDTTGQKFSNTSQLSGLAKFDIFPATIAEFVALTPVAGGGVRQSWDPSFPNLLDGDGDNLLFGADPFDGDADTDNDGLLDRWELAKGFDPFSPDTDNDGLSDYWELFHSTNPFASDTDADGLLDGQEFFHPPSYAGSPANNVAADWSGGWLTTYDYVGTTPLRTRVSANPKTPDTDGDFDSDYYEYVYNFNPRAPYSVDPLEVKSADIAASPEYDYITQRGGTVNYNVTVKSNLDPSLQSSGLLEGELPEDTVQQTQPFTITGQQTLTMSGSLVANYNDFPTTTSTNLTIRAGAYTKDNNAVPLTEDIIQTIPFNNRRADGNILDLSGNNRTSLCNTVITLNCPDFSLGYGHFSIDDNIKTNLLPADYITGSVSISFWILPNQAFASDRYLFELLHYTDISTTYPPILAKVQPDGKTIYVDFLTGNNCPGGTSTRITANASQQFIWGQWNHVAIVNDGSSSALYVNGQGTSVPTAGLCGDIARWEIGDYVSTFEGGLRDWVFYNRSLSSSEIQQESALGFYPTAVYDFDDIPGSTQFDDRQHQSRYGVCIPGDYQYDCPSAGVAGIDNQAIFFRDRGLTAPNDSMILSSAQAYGLGDSDGAATDVSFSVMAWVKGLNWSGRRDVVGSNYSNCPFSCTSFGVKDGYPYMSYYDYNTFNNVYFTATTPINTNQWYHLTWQRDKASNVVRIFVDGVQIMEQPATTFNHTYNADLVLGGNNSNDRYQNYSGWLDQVVITPKALTTTEIQNLIQQAPLLNLHLDEDLSAGTFTNNGAITTIDVTCSSCPKPGVRGQMREAATFTSTHSLTLSGSGITGLNTSDYSVSMWVYPDFNLALSQDLLSINNYEIGLTADMKPTFCAGTDLTYTSNASIGVNRWNHIVLVYNNNTPTIYINGAETATTTSNVAGNCATTNYQLAGNFVGRLDELLVYGQPLSDIRVNKLYDYQSRWFDSRIRPTLLVDAEGPVLNIVTPGDIISDKNGQQIMFSAIDAGIGLDWQLEHYLIDPFGDYFSLSPTEGYTTSEIYIATIPDGLLWRGGEYQVRFRALDKFNYGYDVYYTKTFTVDNGLPYAFLDTPADVLPAANVVTVTGDIADANPFYGSSGINPSSVQVRLLENGEPATSYYPATINGERWESAIRFDGNLYGQYQVELLVEDMVGNANALPILYGTVFINSYPPQVSLLRPNNVITSGNSTLYGVVQTLPYPDEQTAYLPFETVAPFADGSGSQNPVLCTSCPTTATAGRLGTAATFAPTNNLLVSGTLTSNTGTFMLWLKPDWTAGSKGHNPILAQSGNSSFLIDDNLGTLTVDNGTTQQTVPLTLTTNSWHHLALVTDGTVWTAYLDGQPTGTVTQTIDINLPLQIGAPTNGFTGDLDEIVLYQEPVLPYLIYDLANPLTNLSATDVQINTRSLETGLDNWRTATLAQTNSHFTTWSYDFTDQLEGPYQIDLLATNEHNATKVVGSSWNGVIDTQAPQLALSANFNTTTADVTCAATDFYLDEASWACSLTTPPTPTYETAPWYVNTFSDTTHLVALNSGPGTIPLEVVTLTACDQFGQCSTDTVPLPGNGGVSSIFEIQDYTLVYLLDIPQNSDYNGALPAYTIDRSAQVSNFDRVAYYLELDDGLNREWIYVSMDAFSNDATQIGVPVASLFEQNVSNLNVVSNVPGVSIGGPFTTGNIEFWHHCYNALNDSGVPGGNGSIYDVDDQVGAANCYGSMQVHQGGKTLFGYNNWDGSGIDDIGIGNAPATHTDWTFANNTGDWITRTLYVLARPVAAAVNDSYDVVPGIPLQISAPGVMLNDENVTEAKLITPPAHGDLTFNPDGSFSYTLTAMVTTDSFTYQVTDGHYLTKQATVTLDTSNARCLVETNGDGLTDGYSVDASALRSAVTAASPGATIKVGGSCAGVDTGRVLYIDKEITLDGSYSPVNWTGFSLPETQKATIDAAGAGGGLVIDTTGHLIGSGLIITGSVDAGWDGSAIRNLGHLSLADTLITHNEHGGGGFVVYNAANTGWMTITNSSMIANTGRGIYNNHHLYVANSLFVGNEGEIIQNYDSSAALPATTLTVINSVFRDNVGRSLIENSDYALAAVMDTALINNWLEGSYAAVNNAGYFTMTNSTVSGNQPQSASGPSIYGGGGTALNNTGVASLLYSTIVSNTAPNNDQYTGLRNIFYVSSSEPQALYITGSVIAHNGNTTGTANCSGILVNTYFPPDYTDTFNFTGSHNLADDSSCGMTVGNPLLTSLNNPTANTPLNQYHDIQAGSPLLNAIPSNTAGCGTTITTDQRGITRPQNSNCDIGAIEYIPDTTPPAIAITQYLTETNGNIPTFTGLATDDTSITSLTLQIVPATGPTINLPLSLTGDTWEYTMDQPYGDYLFYIEGIDPYGNRTLSGPHPFTYANLTPIVQNESYFMLGMTSLTDPIGVLANDNDPYGDNLTAILQTPPANGTVTLNADGSFTYTPTVGFYGTDSFTYQVSDQPQATLGHWSFNEGVGTTAADPINNFNGTLINDVNWSTNTNFNPFTNPYALQFDGVDDYVEIPDNPMLDLTTFSLSLWVRADQIKNGWQPLVTKEASNGVARNFGLFITPYTLKVHYSIQSADCVTWNSFDTASSLTINQWHHIGMTYDGQVVKIYIDGVLDNSLTLAITPCHNNDPIKLGKEISAYLPFTGAIDELRIYNNVLSSAEMTRLAQSPAPAGTVTIQVASRPVTPTLTVTQFIGNIPTLSWAANAANCNYTIHKSTAPYNSFSLLTTTTTNSYDDATGHVGDTTINDYYYIEASSCPNGDLQTTSKTIGVFDFAITAGS
ncbi:MAG TPA: LamG-like jellyroll fold domain-containing protein [Anaerolineae bacterium]|nr:LamG-like jellyroll fold domain-containing protein [Anaerolineae bacterium]